MYRDSLKAARKSALSYIIFRESSEQGAPTFEEAEHAILEQLQTTGIDPVDSAYAVKSLMFDGFILADEEGKLFPHQKEIPASHRVHANGEGDLMQQLEIVDRN